MFAGDLLLRTPHTAFFIFEIVLVFLSTVKLRNVDLTDFRKVLGPKMSLQSKSGAENCARSTFI
jgi:hypothetical protein